MKPRSIGWRKSLFFILVINLVIVLLLELSTRVLFLALSGDLPSLVYGLDPDIKVSGRGGHLWDIRFYEDCVDCAIAAAQEPTQFASAVSGGAPARIWIFGGSTTAGVYCSRHSSSWPTELASIANGVEIQSFAKAGMDSDFAFQELTLALQNGVPDLVLWANWFNERYVGYYGLKRNYDRLINEYPDTGVKSTGEFFYNTVTHFLRRLHKSLYMNSTSYLLMSEVMIRVKQRLKDEKGGDIEFRPEGPRFPKDSDRSFEMSVANYAANLGDVAKLSDQLGFKLAIVRLPINYGAPSTDSNGEPREGVLSFRVRFDIRMYQFATTYAAEQHRPAD